MPKHIDDILLGAGIPAEDVVKINSLKDDEVAAFDTKPYLEKVKNNYTTQLSNDPAFFSDLTLDKLPHEVKKKVENAGFGRAAKIVTDKLLKGLGMTEAEFDDLPAETKDKIENLIPVIAERYTKTKTGDKKLQEDLIAARKQLEGFEGIEEKYRTKYEGEANNKITAAIFNAALIGELSSIQGLKIPASDIAATANQILQSKYGYERVGDYSVELRQKDNKTMKVLKPNSSHELTLKEALQEIAVERGWIEKKDEGSGSGSGKVTITPGSNGQLKMVAPHIMDKISQKIATEK